MAMKSPKILLFVTFIFSCISIAITITSIATTSWVTGGLKPKTGTDLEDTVGSVNYGLFTGTATIALIGTQHLSIVCDYGENKCAFSCQTDTDKQEKELNSLINGLDLETCPIPKSLTTGKTFNASGKMELTGKAALDDIFINAGLYLSVVIFLSLALVFATITAVFSIINVVFNPTEKIFGVFGLYIWNGVTSFLITIVMALYGVMFYILIIDNVAIRETLRVGSVFKSEGESMLGWSYRVLFAVSLLHQINSIILWYRKRLLNKEKDKEAHVVAKNDSTLIFY